jgi:6-phosphogluconolactonase (cycloisomerase 2 family)
MEFTNLAKLALGERAPGRKSTVKFCNAWANVQGLHLSKEEALLYEMQTRGNKCTIIYFNYNPDTNEGYIEYYTGD